MRMPWGDHKGEEIDTLPSGYLKWLAGNCRNDTIATEADEEWRYREKFGIHWKFEPDTDPEPKREKKWWEK